MKTNNWRAWLVPYGLPLLIWGGAFAVMIWLMSRTGEDLDLLFLFVVFPVLAFLSGLLFRPPHAWVVPAIVAAGVVIGVFYGPGQGPTLEPDPVTLALVAVLIYGGPILLMIWAGRSLREKVGSQARRHNGPQVPAT